MDKAVLVFSDFEDLSNKEIGEALGLTVPAVKKPVPYIRRAFLFIGQLAFSRHLRYSYPHVEELDATRILRYDDMPVICAVFSPT
jgi:hypothetical protein